MEFLWSLLLFTFLLEIQYLTARERMKAELFTLKDFPSCPSPPDFPCGYIHDIYSLDASLPWGMNNPVFVSL